MSTRSTIALKKSDGSVSAIYCHYDGYHSFETEDGVVISGVGKTLEDHYDTTEKVDELIKKGDASSLYENLEKSKFYNEPHSEYDSVKKWENDHKECFGAEYAYLWDVVEEKWKMYTIEW